VCETVGAINESSTHVEGKKMGLLPCLKLLWFEKNQSIKLGE